MIEVTVRKQERKFKVRLYTFLSWSVREGVVTTKRESVLICFLTKVHLCADIWVFFCIFTEKT